MRTEGPDPEPHQTIDAAALARAITYYQECLAALVDAPPGAATDRARTALDEARGTLWPFLIAIVDSLAKRWAQPLSDQHGGVRGWHDSAETLRHILCIELLDALPKVRPQERLNSPGLLHTIAKRRLIDNHRKEQRQTGTRPEPLAEGSAWLARQNRRVMYIDDNVERVHSDALSRELDSNLLDDEHRNQQIEAVRDFWKARLSAPEYTIVQERLRVPPTAHADIARLLGPSWTNEMVRQRYSRIMRDTREHLQAHGLGAE